MSAHVLLNRGASAFIQSDSPLFDGRGETGPIISRILNVPGHLWDELIDELLRIRNLKDDWDGEGTQAPDAMLVDGAIALAHRLKSMEYPPADRVIASVNGTVYFEWHSLPFGYQEVEVKSPIDQEVR